MICWLFLSDVEIVFKIWESILFISLFIFVMLGLNPGPYISWEGFLPLIYIMTLTQDHLFCLLLDNFIHIYLDHFHPHITPSHLSLTRAKPLLPIMSPNYFHVFLMLLWWPLSLIGVAWRVNRGKLPKATPRKTLSLPAPWSFVVKWFCKRGRAPGALSASMVDVLHR